VTGLAVSGDGTTALSVGANETVALWDIARGRRLARPAPQPPQVLAAAMSSDARWGLFVYAGSIAKVDLETFQPSGQPIKTGQLTGSNADDAIRAVAVSTEGKGLVGGVDGKLFLIDPTEKAEPKPLTGGHRQTILRATFSPSGRLAATGSGTVQADMPQAWRENAVCLWDIKSVALKWKGEGHTSPVSAVTFAANGRLLASGGADGEVRVWDVEDGRSLATFSGHSGKILGLAFAPDGKTLWSGAADRTLRQWRLP
jgi:WD40 repeat protein